MLLRILLLSCIAATSGFVSTAFSFSAESAVPEPVSIGSFGLFLVTVVWIIKTWKPKS